MSEISAVVKLDDSYGNYIDILSISDLSRHSQVRNMISNLSIWGSKNGYSYIRFFTSNGELSNYLKRSLNPFIKNPRFAFFSNNDELLQKLKRSQWNWEMIDSDLERL